MDKMQSLVFDAALCKCKATIVWGTPGGANNVCFVTLLHLLNLVLMYDRPISCA